MLKLWYTQEMCGDLTRTGLELLSTSANVLSRADVGANIEPDLVLFFCQVEQGFGVREWVRERASKSNVEGGRSSDLVVKRRKRGRRSNKDCVSATVDFPR